MLQNFQADILVPPLKYRKKYRFYLVMIDIVSKFCYLRVLRNKGHEQLILAFTSIFKSVKRQKLDKIGLIPISITTDAGVYYF